VKDLRNECETLQLSTEGTRAALIKRLKDHRLATASSEREQDGHESDLDSDACKCDAIL
jgi:hypothetical protein